MTLRLPVEQADELEAVARAEGMSVADAVRVAIAEHIEPKRKDKRFRARLPRAARPLRVVEYLDLTDYLLIAEAVLGVAVEEIARWPGIGLAESALHAPAARSKGFSLG
jgi:hypothetical protein